MICPKSNPKPHEIWPPPANSAELQELAFQRNHDISIKGVTGPIRDFETLFLDFLDNKLRYAVTFNSGTSALLAAYFALGIDESDEIIGPALTYHAALSPAYLLKANVILIDVDYQTRCIDPTKIEDAITENTKALTVVHQWGHPCDMDVILKIAHKYDLPIVEDCSHAHGSRYKGQLCGTFGDVAVFSLQTNKAIFAGEGGILVTNNETICNRATLLGHYRDRSRDTIHNPEYRKYWVTGFGQKLRLSPFNAIVAKYALRHFQNRMVGRHLCLNYFRDRLNEISYIEPPYVADYAFMGAWYGFKPLYKKEVLDNLPKETLIDALRAEGLEISDPSGPCLATLPLYNEERDNMYLNRNKRSNKSHFYPVAQDIERRGLSLPTFWNWERDKEIIDQYITAFKKVEACAHQLIEHQCIA